MPDQVSARGTGPVQEKQGITVRRWNGKLRKAVLWPIALCALVGLNPATAVGAAELLMFEQRACPFCEAFLREIAPDYPRSRAGGRAPLRRVDIWESRTGGIEGLDPAVFTPTFVLVEDGREVGRLMGYPGRRYFYAEIDALIDRLASGDAEAAAPSSFEPTGSNERPAGSTPAR
ncbi:hypothetical protein [Aureimonas sp. Leaf454]|uniref:hypothetical protein n=1 Tax=Aureimonas sp. Leaf454 TaxID=1736381 RepID=UPI003296EF94